jgi:hypothetical protein
LRDKHFLERLLAGERMIERALIVTSIYYVPDPTHHNPCLSDLGCNDDSLGGGFRLQANRLLFIRREIGV